MSGILFSPVPPQQPSTYQLPGSSHAVGPWRVTNTADLLDVLAIPKPQDIILADGMYDNTTAFDISNGHRLYAEKYGRVTFTAGVQATGAAAGSAALRGILFDITSTSKTHNNAAVYGSGQAASSLQIQDCWFEGNGALDAAIYTTNPESLLVERVMINDFLLFGIFADAGDQYHDLNRGIVLLDVNVANVLGTHGTGIKLGNRAMLRRIKIRNTTTYGIMTDSNVIDSEFGDLDIDNMHFAIYIDHFTTNSTFKRMSLGPNIDVGVNSQLIDAAFGHLPAGNNNVISDSVIFSDIVGVYLEQGTIATKVQRVVFFNQDFAAVADYQGVGNSYTENDYSGILPSAVPISTSTPMPEAVKNQDVRVAGLGLSSTGQDARLTGV